MCTGGTFEKGTCYTMWYGVGVMIGEERKVESSYASPKLRGSIQHSQEEHYKRTLYMLACLTMWYGVSVNCNILGFCIMGEERKVEVCTLAPSYVAA